MLFDLLHHELEVVKSFFARGLSWLATEAIAQNIKLEAASEELIEQFVLDPHGPYSFEQILIRSVIQELNALCEFAIQNVWRSVAKDTCLPNGEMAYAANRAAIEKALYTINIEVRSWPKWPRVEHIKELAEGFKHRQRMQPFPVELQIQKKSFRALRLVDPENQDWFAEYEITAAYAGESIAAVAELLTWLKGKYAA